MRREDWFWVAIKVAGLYLLVCAIGDFTVMLGVMVPSGVREPHLTFGGSLVRGVIQLVGGLVLVFHGPAFLLDKAAEAPPADAPSAAPGPTAMSRHDWLWLCCKAAGLLLLVQAIESLFGILSLRDGHMSGPLFLVWVAMAACGLWLLFGEQIPHWAGASKRASPADPGGRDPA